MRLGSLLIPEYFDLYGLAIRGLKASSYLYLRVAQIIPMYKTADKTNHKGRPRLPFRGLVEQVLGDCFICTEQQHGAAADLYKKKRPGKASAVLDDEGYRHSLPRTRGACNVDSKARPVEILELIRRVSVYPRRAKVSNDDYKSVPPNPALACCPQGVHSFTLFEQYLALALPWNSKRHACNNLNARAPARSVYPSQVAQPCTHADCDTWLPKLAVIC